MPIQLSTATPEVVDDTDVDPVDEKEQGWNVVVWDDPVNTMQFVVYVFRTMFRFTKQKATMLMLQVHHEGKAIVATEGLELAERYCARLHEYGLLATIEAMGQWLIDVLDAAGIETATLIGFSMGTSIALEVAARAPERVRKISLAGAAPSPAT